MCPSGARGTARQLDYNKDEVEALLADMQSSDYNHLVRTFNDHFGRFFTLYTTDNELLDKLKDHEEKE